MSLENDGAQRFEAVLDEDTLGKLSKAVSHVAPDKPGMRLKGIPQLKTLLSVGGVIGAIAGAIIGSRARPVRAVLFNKTQLSNWKLRWHQDRTIVVRSRAAANGFGPWSVKAGLQHVEPPFDLLAEMLTLRVHLDSVNIDNAPLLIAPGSHRMGRVVEPDIKNVVKNCGTFTCLSKAGDVWLYATPILHGSEPVRTQSRRRVLQVDYSARDLPLPLQWLGI